jgi:hypothetical protein
MVAIEVSATISIPSAPAVLVGGGVMLQRELRLRCVWAVALVMLFWLALLQLLQTRCGS